MVNNIKNVGAYHGGATQGSRDEIPPLIAAIMQKDKNRIINLLAHTDPNGEYEGKNAYEHAALKFINLIVLLDHVSMNEDLLNLHRKAIRNAHRRKTHENGPGVFEGENNFDEGKGPGIIA